MDGIHAADTLRGRDAAIKLLKEHAYTAILFSGATVPMDTHSSILYKDLRELMVTHGDKRLSGYPESFIFQYLWKELKKTTLEVNKIFTIEFQGAIIWSDINKYYGTTYEYAFSETETEFHYGYKNFDDIDHENNLFLVLIENPK